MKYVVRKARTKSAIYAKRLTKGPLANVVKVLTVRGKTVATVVGKKANRSLDVFQTRAKTGRRPKAAGESSDKDVDFSDIAESFDDADSLRPRPNRGKPTK